jgi:hypothetical protein
MAVQAYQFLSASSSKIMCILAVKSVRINVIESRSGIFPWGTLAHPLHFFSPNTKTFIGSPVKYQILSLGRFVGTPIFATPSVNVRICVTVECHMPVASEIFLA